jgi:hypothetical protein
MNSPDIPEVLSSATWDLVDVATTEKALEIDLIVFLTSVSAKDKVLEIDLAIDLPSVSVNETESVNVNFAWLNHVSKTETVLDKVFCMLFDKVSVTEIVSVVTLAITRASVSTKV